jgi:hypothetical protein
MADPPAGRFTVSIITDRLEELRQLHRIAAAAAAGDGEPFLRWVNEIQYRLAYEADEWGESRGRYPGDRVEVRFGVAGDLVVWYTVDFARAVAYVREFRLRGDPGAGAVGAS